MIAGLVGTLAISVFMVAKAVSGMMPELNTIRMLADVGQRFFGTPEIPFFGWFYHAVIGIVAWGNLFGAAADDMPFGPYWVRALVFSTLAWLVMMLGFMPVAVAGFFGARLGAGVGVAVITLLLHWVFGLALGLTYGRLRRAA
ncbi:hypothetical protein H0Z60_21015 [Ectothiorhodospiraceae bacterium WFHF3C12]|nr:hypothetical protein [Ectothiorhodospiraceae bacterium WFHF3C12]